MIASISSSRSARRWRTQASTSASFQHYAQGNALRRAPDCTTAPTRPARVVRRIRERYTRSSSLPRAGMGCAAPDPIFIVGLPRAGSTLIEQILSSHSPGRRHDGAAGHHLDHAHAARAGRCRQRHRLSRGAGGASSGDALRALGEHYLARTRIQRKTSAPFFIDKMPNNFTHLGLIHLILPNAKIIDARRHPTGLLLLRLQAALRARPELQLRPGRPRPLLPRLRRADGAFRCGAARPRPPRHLRAHGRATPKARCAVCSTIAALPFEDACLRFYENDRPVRTASSEQVRQPIYRERCGSLAALRSLARAVGGALGAGARELSRYAGVK